MAKNVYQQRDDVVQGAVDTAVRRLANPGGVKSQGFHDNSKPALDYAPPSPATIKEVGTWPKKLRIRTPQ